MIECPAQSLSRGYKGDHGGHIGQDQADVFPREGPLREIARRTGLSRNTVRRWLRQTDAVEPKYPKRVSPSVIDDWAAQLTGWLRADSHRPKRDRRTARFMFEAIRAEVTPAVMAA
nr:helix-turn-helix domain-containing protein [Burkholderia glumae]